MAKLFGVDIAAIIKKEVGPGLFPGTLYSKTAGTRNPADPTAGPQGAVVTTHTFRGIAQTYTDDEIDNNLILREDRKILIIAGTLSPAIEPLTGMTVTVDGTPGLFEIVRVKRDPASATYLCQGRR
jgi:hypothetical protein